MNLNKVFLIGRLTRDPESKALPSGQSVVNFGLATDRFFANKSGQKQQQTDFHNIVAFGRLAEIVSQFLTKGSLVMIEGRLRTRSWQGQDGQSRSRTEIIAERLQLGPKSAGKVAPPETPKEEIPVIEEEEIDLKDIPF
jgi:single-strand DNA-binding protein